MRYLLPLFIGAILLTSCAEQVASGPEIEALQSVIKSQFQGIPTAQTLLTVSVPESKTYEEHRKPLVSKTREEQMKETPKLTPDRNLEKVQMADNVFRLLIKNQMIDQKNYEDILSYISKRGLTIAELPKTDNVYKDTYQSVLEGKKHDTFQSFGYPVMVDNLLIIYRNHFTSIKSGPELVGNGVYYIYRNNGTEWKMVTKVTKWIS